jgi:hypothetical protein
MGRRAAWFPLAARRLQVPRAWHTVPRTAIGVSGIAEVRMGRDRS